MAVEEKKLLRDNAMGGSMKFYTKRKKTNNLYANPSVRINSTLVYSCQKEKKRKTRMNTAILV